MKVLQDIYVTLLSTLGQKHYILPQTSNYQCHLKISKIHQKLFCHYLLHFIRNVIIYLRQFIHIARVTLHTLTNWHWCVWYITIPLNLISKPLFWSRSRKACNIANKTCSSYVRTVYFHEVPGQKKVKWIFQTKKDFITCSKLIINELARCPTRSDNLYFPNNEETSLPFTAAFCFAHAEHNLIKLKLCNNWSGESAMWNSSKPIKFFTFKH